MTRLLRVVFELIYPASILAQGLRWIAVDDVFGLSVNYNIMGKLMPEVGWGHLFIFASILSFAGIIACKRQYRRLALYVCGGLWFFVGLSIVFSNPSASFAFPLIFLGISSVIRTIEIPRGTA